MDETCSSAVNFTGTPDNRPVDGPERGVAQPRRNRSGDTAKRFDCDDVPLHTCEVMCASYP